MVKPVKGNRIAITDIQNPDFFLRGEQFFKKIGPGNKHSSNLWLPSKYANKWCKILIIEMDELEKAEMMKKTPRKINQIARRPKKIYFPKTIAKQKREGIVEALPERFEEKKEEPKVVEEEKPDRFKININAKDRDEVTL